MTKTKRLTTQDQIVQLTARLKHLKELLKDSNKRLKKTDSGVSEAISQLERVATSHNMSFGDVIKAFSRIKRTGLRISDPVPKRRRGKPETVHEITV